MYPNDLGVPGMLPEGSFITASGDDTIRVWNLDPQMDNNATGYKRNIFSNVRIASSLVLNGT